ncbi:MAG: protein-L-isoaspartate(D-aspartate) O-methyltransferase [Thermoguttaceae bacterium]|nr:protein-L-isoaspartate(D-aspartate) O-methyltransferase [Thermoguttaceae bacterium]
MFRISVCASDQMIRFCAVSILLLIWGAVAAVNSDVSSATAKEPQEVERPIVPEARRMVLEILVPTKQLESENVLKAMMRVPRALFVPRELRSVAYQDFALSIGDGQTISPPFVVAYMTEVLDPQPTDKVLEIGTGSGYQAAILGLLVSKVYTIEIVRPLGKKAQSLLKKLKYDNVFCRVGDGYKGWEDAAPFDKIIVTCSPEEIPQPLIDQLKEGGKMLIPIGDRYHQYFYLCTKTGTELKKDVLIPAFFVPMTGQAEETRKEQPDPKNPSIVGGSFEEINTGSPGPVGWYYTRNVEVKDDDNAPDGKRILVFDNTPIVQAYENKNRLDQRELSYRQDTSKPVRQTDSEEDSRRHNQYLQELTTHLLQPFPVDGVSVKRLNFSCMLHATDLKPLDRRQTIPLVTISYFDADWNYLDEQIVIAVGKGNFEWRKFERFDLPVPRKAKFGSLRMGILDGTGKLEVDSVELAKAKKR